MSDGMTFICTGQGGRGVHDPAEPQEQEPDPSEVGRRENGPATQLACPVCGRNVRLGYRVRQKLITAGLRQVDISLLPF